MLKQWVKILLANKNKNATATVDTGRKLNVHDTFRRRPGGLLNVLCTFNLRPVSAGAVFLFTSKNIATLEIETYVSQMLDHFYPLLALDTLNNFGI